MLLLRNVLQRSTSRFVIRPISTTSPIDHVVLLKLKPDVTKAQVQALKEKAATLTSIEGVTAITCGHVFVESWMQDRTAGKNFGIRVTLTSKAALRAYQDDPHHVKVVKENIAPLISEPPLACDWEFSS